MFQDGKIKKIHSFKENFAWKLELRVRRKNMGMGWMAFIFMAITDLFCENS